MMDFGLIWMKLQTFVLVHVSQRTDCLSKLQFWIRLSTHLEMSILRSTVFLLMGYIMMDIMSLIITLSLGISKEKQQANILQKLSRNDHSLSQEIHSQVLDITFHTGMAITLQHGNSLSTQLLEQWTWISSESL